ncbi:MAG: patatin-like phospholipase family protein [Hyphomonadaceae bacterium]|nr:patatin-like phospholipase family protein [Hyphomonadaceae bacterium]
MRRTFEQHLDPTVGPKRILSLSGGGVRGLVTLGTLAHLEAMIRSEFDDESIVLSDFYDLIAGTSTGSIISVSLAMGWEVSRIKALYDELCPILFRPNRRLGFFKPRFEAQKLQDVLEQHLVDEQGEDLELGSPALKTGLLICAKRMDTDSAWLLTNHPNARFFQAGLDQSFLPNKHYKLKDLVRASTAAPTYLSPMRITISDGRAGFPKDDGVFVDGAIGGQNNPSLAALKIATLPSYKFNWKRGADQLSILSIGTGYFRQRIGADAFLKRRTVEQGIAALSSMISESERNTLMMLQSLSNPRRPRIINGEIEGLEGELLTEKPILGFQHIDVELNSSDIRERLKLHSLKGAQMDKIRDGLRDMANGRKKNLAYCYQLGASLGTDLVTADLFA